MSESVNLPALGESVTEGTVTRWLKQVGDRVEVDEPLLEVSTDKVDTEIPSPVAGTLLEITAGEDETVDVGGQLAVIGDASEQSESEPEPEPEPEAKAEPKSEPDPKSEPEAEPQAKSEPEPEPKAEPKPAPAAQEPSSDGQSNGPAPYVTPLVRKLAAE